MTINAKFKAEKLNYGPLGLERIGCISFLTRKIGYGLTLLRPTYYTS